MTADIYSYVGSNPYLAKSILNSFGYTSRNNDMASSLKALVASEGEPALKAIVDAHPDKDLILEMCSQPKQEHISCSCDMCNQKEALHWSANGIENEKSNPEVSLAKNVQDNFSIIFLAGVTIIAVAIMSK